MNEEPIASWNQIKSNSTFYLFEYWLFFVSRGIASDIYLITRLTKSQCWNSSWISMINAKTFLVESIPCWYETIRSPCGKCLILNWKSKILRFLHCNTDLLVKRNCIDWIYFFFTILFLSMAFEGISEFWNHNQFFADQTYRFFCISAVGSKYSTETRPSIDEMTNPIPFGKHLIARVWYLRFDSRFCWHTSRKLYLNWLRIDSLKF